MLMMSNDTHHDWHDRFVKETEENARLRAELEETRAKYDYLLEASLQQLASRLEDINKRHSPTNHNNPITLNSSNNNFNNTSSANLISHNHPLSVSVSVSEEAHPLNTSTNNVAISDKKQQPSNSATTTSVAPSTSSTPANATPTKKNKERGIFGGIGINFQRDKKKDKKEKEKGGMYTDLEDPRTDFALPLGGPSTSYQHLPRLQVCSLVSRNHVVISGPNGPVGPIPEDESGSASYVDIVAGRSISTYPHIPGNPNRDGDPIADRFCAHVFENRVIASVADGCNWGAKPREAAVKANTAFIEYVNASHDTITDVKKAGAVLLSAFEYAHNSIMEGKLAFWDAGTTTLLGGVLLEINKTDKFTPQWEFVCASVGDCKAFCYHDGEISDITQGNRQNASDPRDCGGRLGPHDEGKPDLRNLNLFCAPCEDGDLIIIVTDGIHDNLDPQHLGRVPKDMPKEFNLTGDKWDEVDSAKAIFAKNAYITELLLRLLKTGEETPTPKEVADRLVAHCIQVTQKSREYMENNQGKRLPEDYIEFPGKMDHTTCLCFRVGRFPSLPEKSTITPSSAQVPSLSNSSSSLFLASSSIPTSSPNLAISATSQLANSSQITRQEDESPRLAALTGSPGNMANPKFDNWTKISPSIKHS